MDLWSGISGTIMALLALGIRVIALAAEWDEDARDVAAKNMPNIVHMSKVEDIEPDMLKKVLSRRTFSGIIIGGGSPCQGNSSLNASRKGLGDERSRQPLLLSKLADDIELLSEVADQHIPVMRWLENVASSPTDVRQAYSLWLGSPGMPCGYLCTEAAEYGYAKRSRLWWGRCFA